MPAIRNIVRDMRFEVSAGTRKCDVNKTHRIAKGETHFAYEENYGHRLNICMKCAPAIIKKAYKEISALLQQVQ